MDRAMNGEIAANKLADVTITVKPMPLTAGQLRALGALPNVAAVTPGHLFDAESDRLADRSDRQALLRAPDG